MDNIFSSNFFDDLHTKVSTAVGKSDNCKGRL